MSFFTSDRAVKYGWGAPRLAVITCASFVLAPLLCSSPSAASGLTLWPYLASRRWLLHAYLGAAGAVVNVEVLPMRANLGLLALAACLVAWDARLDYGVFIYLAKTFGGDFLAGKLDTAEWKAVLFFTFGVCAPAALWLERAAPLAAARPYFRILPLLFLAQACCELGDARLEHLRFFRHRYSFEVASCGLLALRLAPAELAVVQHDLVTCLFYRIANFAIILARSEALQPWTAVRRACFSLFGALRGGPPLQNVTDAAVAMAVLRSSDCKGACLERFVASPAWAPVLSLESIDGPLYRQMIGDLHTLMAALPPASALQAISTRLCGQLSAPGAPRIDAEAVARLSVAAFVEYLFGVTWHQGLQVLWWTQNPAYMLGPL